MKTGYYFAHISLAEAFFNDPKSFWELVLQSPTATEKLTTAWDALAEEFRETRPSAGLKLEPCSLGKSDSGYLLTLPAARTPLEAYFVLFARTAKAHRYFTLEKAEEEGSMVGEWSADGTHANLGPGPRPGEKQAFVNLIQRLLCDNFR